MSLTTRFSGWLTINRLCNLNCSWCYAKSIKASKRNDMSMETVDKAVQLFRKMPMESVILIGGEPTIHPNFLNIVKSIKSANLQPFLVTNGIMLAKNDFLSSAIDAGLAGVTISIKASNEEQYSELTGKSAFRQVLAGIKNTAQSGMNHKISITATKTLFKSFDEMLAIVVDSQVESFSLDMERPVILNQEVQKNGMATPREMAKFFYEAYPKMVASGVDFTLKISIPFCLFSKDFINELVKNDHIISGCQIFTGKGIILDPQGFLLPCNHFCNNPLGEIGLSYPDGTSLSVFCR